MQNSLPRWIQVIAGIPDIKHSSLTAFVSESQALHTTVIASLASLALPTVYFTYPTKHTTILIVNAVDVDSQGSVTMFLPIN